MEADDLPAGPELDALIANRLMGVSISPHCYSTDIHAALEVFDRLSERFRIAEICKTQVPKEIDGSNPNHLWSVFLYKKYVDPTSEAPEVAAVGETAPLAICRAALKVVGF